MTHKATDKAMKVEVTLGTSREKDWKVVDWLDRLLELGKFLRETASNQTVVTIYAYEDEKIGGLRVAEVSFVIANPGGGIAGSSYLRGDTPEFAVLCENFLSTCSEEPYRPPGWESRINDHGEARLALLRFMGLNEAADIEYADQFKTEQTIAES